MDIVERLMNRHCCQDNFDQEAAEEIKRLRKELKIACQALLLAANRLENLGSLDCDAGDAYDAADAARIALKEKEPSKWKCPMGYASCKESCGNYGCGN
jgi:hypothetical protein